MTYLLNMLRMAFPPSVAWVLVSVCCSLMLFGCVGSTSLEPIYSPNGDERSAKKYLDEIRARKAAEAPSGELEARLRKAGLVDVSSLDEDIRVDLRYAGTKNLMDSNLYGSLNRCYLQLETAARLSLAQDALE